VKRPASLPPLVGQDEVDPSLVAMFRDRGLAHRWSGCFVTAVTAGPDGGVTVTFETRAAGVSFGAPMGAATEPRVVSVRVATHGQQELDAVLALLGGWQDDREAVIVCSAPGKLGSMVAAVGPLLLFETQHSA
jgi:hypothetical protein